MNEDFKKFFKSRSPYHMSALDDYARATNFGGLSPMILEERKMNVLGLDIFSRLLLDRTVWFGTQVDSESANILMAELLYLDSLEETPITLIIASPGGECNSGLGIYDTLQGLNSETHSLCPSLAASFGAVLLAACDKRSALEHASIMVHEPRIMGHGITGRATDIEIEAIEMKKTKETLTSILAKHSNKTYEEMWEICKLDTWLTSKEALEYGLIDEVIANKDRSHLKWKPENS